MANVDVAQRAQQLANRLQLGDRPHCTLTVIGFVPAGAAGEHECTTLSIRTSTGAHIDRPVITSDGRPALRNGVEQMMLQVRDVQRVPVSDEMLDSAENTIAGLRAAGKTVLPA